MIKFFRKIRQKLITENKFTKYLIYAIGEIVLVVIGILIALQINNWNESQKALKAEVQLYSTLLDDLNDQFRFINDKISYLKNYQYAHFHVYNETRGIAQYDSTLDYNLLQYILPNKFTITEKYSEFLTGITNDKINDLLKEYISREKGTIVALEEWNEFKVQRLRPFFNKYGIHNTEAVFTDELFDFGTSIYLDLIDYSKLKKQYGTTELDELLFDLRFKTSWIFGYLKGLVNANNILEKELINELILNKQSESINKIPRRTLSDLLAEEKTIDEIFELLKNDDKIKPIYYVTEWEIYDFGYNLWGHGKKVDALKIFKLNTELYPNAWNTYDSYGEYLLMVGDTINAIRAYKKLLELNPGNTNAEKELVKIE